MGTAAIENPKWCEKIISKYGDFIAISLDIRSSNLAGRGWTTEAGSWKDTLKQLSDAGCARFVVTDVGSDGMLSGPNFGLLSEVCEQTDAKIVASGGVSKVEDIKELKKFGAKGLEGVIIGTALYVGNFTLPEALAAASEKDESN
ncbi:MAG: hypothetical protein CR979_03175 [Propionibacterium sp.]|nr:MAG: hypothetical protein CR979_03175 [Propionibacterium sp.]